MKVIQDGHVDRKQLIVMIWILIAAKIFIPLPAVMAQRAGNSGWIPVFIGAGVGAFGALAIGALMLKFPSMSIVDISREVLGGILGRIVAGSFVLFFGYLTAVVLREFAETFATVILPQTPLSTLVIILMLLLTYAAYGGIETIARTCQFFLPFLLIPFVTIFLAGIPYIDLGRLRPVLGAGTGRLLVVGLMATSIYSEVIFAAIIAPFLREKDDAIPGMLISILLSALVMASTVAVSVAVFSVEGSSRLAFPLLQLTRLISIGEFIQRIEAIFVFLWFFTAALKLSMSLYATVVSTAQLLGLEKFRPLIPAFGLITFTVSFIPGSIVAAFRYDTELRMRYAAIPGLVLPALILLVALILRKGGRGGLTSDDTTGS